MYFLTTKEPYESRLRETKLARIHIFSPARLGVRFVTDYISDASSTRKRLPLHIAFRANYHIEIGFGRRNGDGSCICGGIENQIEIFDDVELWKAICVSILLRVSFESISVTKLWDMIIHLCICKGHMQHSNVVNSKSRHKTTNEPVIVFHVTVVCQRKTQISDEIY